MCILYVRCEEKVVYTFTEFAYKESAKNVLSIFVLGIMGINDFLF